MDAWPATLPEFFESGSHETPPTDRLESESEAGLSAVRRRLRSRTRAYEAAIVVDLTQLATFKTFHDTTLAGGVKPFTWVHPRTRAAAAFRFKGPPPAFTPRASGALILISFQLVQVQ